MSGSDTGRRTLGWLGIFRLGLVQTAIGAIVVLTTSTLNRVMVVELALPALVPGLLIGLHYGLQLSRPRWGYGSDVGGRRTPWIIGGMFVLAAGGFLAALATSVMADAFAAGLMLAILAFTLIGVGVGAAGTSLLVLLSQSVDPMRRAAAATIVWVMMIFGFIVTAGTAGHYLDPFSISRLVTVSGIVSLAAFTVTVLALLGVERSVWSPSVAASSQTSTKDFKTAFAEVWSETEARRFTIFVFLSMFAYSAQDLILEPFAGALFGLTPGQSTKLAGVQHSGVLIGMIAVAILATGWRGLRIGTLKQWTIAGCLASAAALVVLAVGGHMAPDWPLHANVFALGFANGVFAVSAIGSMMALVGQGRERREGVRMGLWGAAQAIAFGLGGLSGAAAADLIGHLTGSSLTGYAGVFVAEAGLFLIAAAIAQRVGDVRTSSAMRSEPRLVAIGDNLLGEYGEVR